MPAVIRDLWPTDIKTEEVITPEEILRHQGQLLQDRTNGILRGVVVGMEGDDRSIMEFEVEAPRLNTRTVLFTVEHRPDYEYPVRIVPPTDALPDYLQPKSYVPGRPALGISMALLAETKGKWVENRWVATSPPEFTEKIGEVLAIPSVKAIVLSLIARSVQEDQDASEERGQEQASSDDEGDASSPNPDG